MRKREGMFAVTWDLKERLQSQGKDNILLEGLAWRVQKDRKLTLSLRKREYLISQGEYSGSRTVAQAS